MCTLMTLVGMALDLSEKMKIYPQVLTFFIKPQIWLFQVVREFKKRLSMTFTPNGNFVSEIRVVAKM